MLAVSLLALLAFAAQAAASPAPSKDAVTPYYLPRTPPTGGGGPITFGPDGNVWFTEVAEEAPEAVGESVHHPPQIVRMNALGQVAVVAEHQRAEAFATAPDGSVWFLDFRHVGRIGPNDALSTFPMPGEWETPTISFASESIVAAPDGNLWFAGTRQSGEEGGKGTAPFVNTIDRVTPSGEISEFDVGPGGAKTNLAFGPDGNIWFAVPGRELIGRMTPTGQVTEIPMPLAAPWDIVAGPDGALWFSVQRQTLPALGRVTTAGKVTEILLPGGEETGAGPVAVGPDGRLWIGTEPGSVMRVSPKSGRVSKVDLPSTTRVADLVAGPDGNVWYSAPAEPPCLIGDTACGGGGFYESGIIGRIEPAPLSVQIQGAGLAAHGRIRVRLACLDGRADSLCRGRLRLRAAGATAGKRSYTLGVDSSRAFGVKLDPRAWERLRRRGKLTLTVKATVAGGRGKARGFTLNPHRHG